MSHGDFQLKSCPFRVIRCSSGHSSINASIVVRFIRAVLKCFASDLNKEDVFIGEEHSRVPHF